MTPDWHVPGEDLIGFFIVQLFVWWAILHGLAERRVRRKRRYIEERRLERAPVDEGELPFWEGE